MSSKKIKVPNKKEKVTVKPTFIKNIIFKLRSERSKQIIISHLIPNFFFLLVSIFIIRKLIGVEGDIINADLVRPPELERFVTVFYPMWREYESVSTLNRLPGLLLYLPFFAIGYIFQLETTEILILLFIFTETLTGSAMYYTSKYFLTKTYKSINNIIIFSAFCAGLAYMWHGYIIFHALHPMIRTAYAFAPLIILTMVIAIEEKKPMFIILTAFLWCVACADFHWVVYGAILLFSLIIFYFLLDFIKSSYYDGKLKALRKSLIFYLKYSIILILSFIGFSCYWLIPGLLMGGTSRYSYIITVEDLEKVYSQSTILHMIRKQGEHPLIQEMFAGNVDFVNSAIFQNLIIIFGFLLFIFGILALVLKPKNRYIIFFAVFTIFSLFITTAVNFVPEFGIWLINDAPLHELYGWAIRSPKIAQFIILALCFLLSFSLVEILTRLKITKFKVKKFNSINFKKGLALCVISILFLSIFLPNWPLATGDLNTRMSLTEIPDEFDRVNSWLDQQEGDFKVLWLPRYHSRNVDWNKGHRTILDIDSLTSSKPSYVFYTPHTQPNGYGIYFLDATTGSLSQSIIIDNATNNFGKLLMPLGIKYIIVHDDNATLQGETELLINNLKFQDDLKLVQKFGFIYVFENKYTDNHDSSHFFTTSKNSLVYGGLTSLATLNSIPNFESRKDGLIFGNQKSYKGSDLDEIVNDIVFTKSTGLEEIALSLTDDKYFIAPYDFSDHYAPHRIWSKTKISELNWLRLIGKNNIETWDWEYDSGIVFTWAPGEVASEPNLQENDIIRKFDFESNLDNFSVLTPNLEIYSSRYSMEGERSLKGYIPKGIDQQTKIASTEFIKLPTESNNYRFSMYIAGENSINLIVKLKFFDENKKYIKQSFLFLESGNFEFKKIEKDINLPIDYRYMRVQILADRNQVEDSSWWVDDIRLYDLKYFIEPNELKMGLDIDKTDNYNILIRCLKSKSGGIINIGLDGKLISSITTIDRPDAFYWIPVTAPIRIKEGSHKLTIENVDGFNAVNLIAVIPETKSESCFELADEFLNEKELLYTLEAESNFYYENGSLSDQYGSETSLGEVLQLENNGKAWVPIEILRSGNYSLSMRLATGVGFDELNISIGNNYYLMNAQHENFSWFDINNISLESGHNELKISSKSIEMFQLNDSFENGWNMSKNAPENWLPPTPMFSAKLDQISKTDGEFSLMLTTNSTNSSLRSQMESIPTFLKPDTYYNLKIDMRTKNINNSKIGIKGYNRTAGKWELIDNLVSGLKGNKEWQTYEKVFYLPRNFTKIIVLLNVGTVLNSSTGNATAWFDNFKLSTYIEDFISELDLVTLLSNENGQTLYEKFNSDQVATITDYEKIDSTRYKVKISSTGPFILGFAEVYDNFWVASGSGIGTVESIPIYGMLNGFYIDKIGNFTITLEYLPQQWFNLGMGITGISIFVTFSYFIWIERKKWGGKFKKLIKKEVKITDMNKRKKK